jgi:hypothetical protein
MVIRLTLFLSTLCTVGIVHLLATSFYLYWKYPWFDIPMHFLGGVVCAFGFSILPFFRIILPTRYTSVYGYVVFVLIVGIAWEIFEVVSGISLQEHDFIIDTLTDIGMDIAGTLSAYLFIRRGTIITT